jgi:hypothetical protein
MKKAEPPSEHMRISETVAAKAQPTAISAAVPPCWAILSPAATVYGESAAMAAMVRVLDM